MTDRQLAALWWRQLFSELGTAANADTPGGTAQLAKERHAAVAQLFFTLLLELPTDGLLEVGANNADPRSGLLERNRTLVPSLTKQPRWSTSAWSARGARTIGMHNCAIGTRSGPVKFFVPRDPRNHLLGIHP